MNLCSSLVSKSQHITVRHKIVNKKHQFIRYHTETSMHVIHHYENTLKVVYYSCVFLFERHLKIMNSNNLLTNDTKCAVFFHIIIIESCD